MAAAAVNRLTQRATKSPGGTRQGRDVITTDAVTQCIEMAETGEHAGIGMLETKVSLAAEPVADLMSPAPEVRAAVAEAEKVVDIAHVPRHLELTLDDVIKSVQVDMSGEELAGVGADRQATIWRWPVGLEASDLTAVREGIETVGLIKHAIDDGEEPAVTDAASDQHFEYVAIDTREVALDVEVEHESMATHEALKS